MWLSVDLDGRCLHFYAANVLYCIPYCRRRTPQYAKPKPAEFAKITEFFSKLIQELTIFPDLNVDDSKHWKEDIVPNLSIYTGENVSKDEFGQMTAEIKTLLDKEATDAENENAEKLGDCTMRSDLDTKCLMQRESRR